MPEPGKGDEEPLSVMKLLEIEEARKEVEGAALRCGGRGEMETFTWKESRLEPTG